MRCRWKELSLFSVLDEGTISSIRTEGLLLKLTKNIWFSFEVHSSVHLGVLAGHLQPFFPLLHNGLCPNTGAITARYQKRSLSLCHLL